jgi:hypothetical protein
LGDIQSQVGRPTSIPTFRQTMVHAIGMMRRWRDAKPGIHWPMPTPGCSEALFELAIELPFEIIQRDLQADRLDFVVAEPRKMSDAGHGLETRILVQGRFPFRIIVRTPQTNRESDAGCWWSLDQTEQYFQEHFHDADLEAELLGVEYRPDRFEFLHSLLELLEDVFLEEIPHKDLLTQSLCVFEVLVQENGFDEELLTAGLLLYLPTIFEDDDEMAAMLEGAISARTLWLMVNVRKLPMANPVDRDDLRSLMEAEKTADRMDASAFSLEEAVDYLRSLAFPDS